MSAVLELQIKKGTVAPNCRDLQVFQTAVDESTNMCHLVGVVRTTCNNCGQFKRFPATR